MEEGERGGPPFGDLAHKHVNGVGEKTTEQVAQQRAGTVEETGLILSRKVAHQLLVCEQIEHLGEPTGQDRYRKVEEAVRDDASSDSESRLLNASEGGGGSQR